MAENYVSIKIKASDTAKPDLTELRAQLAELGRTVENAKVDIDDKDGTARLTAFNAKLAAIGRRVDNAHIGVAGAARAEADIAALDLALDNFGRKSEEARVRVNSAGGRGGLLGRLLFGAAADSGGGGGSGGGAASEAGGLAGLLPSGGLMLGIGALIPAIGGLATEAAGLISGFAAAGAGVGAFGVLAIPTIKKISGAMTQLSADQAAYNRATTAAGRSTALKHIHDDLKSLDPAERAAVRGIHQLSATYSRMAKAFEPDVFKVFNTGLKVANNLLPTLKPFADTAATAIDGLLKKLAAVTAPAVRTPFHAGAGPDPLSKPPPSGWQQFLAAFQKLEGPALTAIGAGFGRVAVSLGKLLTVMSAKDVVHAINIAFGALSGTVSALTWVVQRMMKNWDTASSAFRRTRHDIATAGHDIAHVFDDIRHGTAVLAAAFVTMRNRVSGDVSALLARVTGAWFHGWGSVVSFTRGLPGRIVAGLAGLPGMLFRAGANAVRSLISGLLSQAGALGSAVGSLAGKVAGFFGLSPAKEGPLSGGGAPEIRGAHFGEAFASGLGGRTGAVGAAAARMAGAAGLVPSGHAAAAGGHGAVQLQVMPGGGSAFEAFMVKMLREFVRTKGQGSVQKAFGTG